MSITIIIVDPFTSVGEVRLSGIRDLPVGTVLKINDRISHYSEYDLIEGELEKQTTQKEQGELIKSTPNWVQMRQAPRSAKRSKK